MGADRQSRILLLGAAGLLAFVSACSEPETFLPTNTDLFTNHSSDDYTQASAFLKGDYVFVMDYSYSMSRPDHSKLNALFDSLHGFTQNLADKNIDYKIGFILGNVQGNSSDALPEQTIAESISTDFLNGVLTPDIGTGLETEILNRLKPIGGALQPNRNYFLESALRVMNHQGDSFLRDYAQLIYVFVSDGDDTSQTNKYIRGVNGDKSPIAYGDALSGFKDRADYVNARAIVAGVGTGCALQSQDDHAGVRLSQAVDEADAKGGGTECIYNDFSSSLQNLARNVVKPTKNFQLQEKAIVGSVRVFIEGKEVAASGHWKYLPDSNEVVFDDGSEPRPSQHLQIVYEVGFYLSKIPNTSSIEVSVNDKAVPAEGWTYVADENRIAFKGSFKPGNGDKVRIVYQVTGGEQGSGS